MAGEITFLSGSEVGGGADLEPDISLWRGCFRKIAGKAEKTASHFPSLAQ